ncbi:hypothetical protein V6N13_073055 [Hibiscus sabdariffa]|uniref:RNase H type-1 domain-containing protein n=1 Tax=Hibiscus sabdariffa TaxID=183260 RepID=A0ABR2E7Z1_9ROSI
MEVIRIIQDGGRRSQYSSFVACVVELLNGDWEVCVYHVNRCGNNATDGLAKLPDTTSTDVSFFVDSPISIVQALQADAITRSLHVL